MHIYCANPKEQYIRSQAEIENAVLKVMRGGKYILGEEVQLLEKEFSDYIGVNNCIGVANGTDAIELILRGLNISFGDEVITTSFTAVATVAAIEAAGAIPVLAEIDEYFGIDPQKLSDLITDKTKAILVVHLYGQSVDLDAIIEICKKNNLKLIEDVSQAHGAMWNNLRLGSFGHAAAFSCYPTKNLGALGDAGLVVTKSDELAKKIRMIREYGWAERYKSEIVGKNSRLDEIQAAILRIKLKHLDADNDRRRKIAKIYDEYLSQFTGIDNPKVRANARHVYHLYAVTVDHDKRDLIIEQARKNNIYFGIHYPAPVHLQQAYKDRIKVAACMDITENKSMRVISLPMYPELSEDQINKVCNIIKNTHKQMKE